MVATGKVVFILGIGRSGSTMLDLMLGSHSQGFSLGEISKLPEIYRRTPTLSALCPSGTFWPDHFSQADAEQLALGLSGRRLRAYLPLKLERWIRERIGQDAVFNPYTLLAERIQKTLLVDSSKYPDWVAQRLKAREFRQGRLQAYVIHAVRDGRAVLNSYLRAYPALTVETVSQRWLENLDQCDRLYASLPANRRLQVQYEALATEPAEIMRQVCAFLEIPFEPEMLAYWQHDHHYIAGSRSARALIARYRNQPVASNTQAVHGDYYAKMDLTIKLDQRWQQELAPENLERFYAIVGDRNQPFAWE
ncbi:sulfotransferase [Sphaerothrix gracilis]|uniref:sulfotransferase family protein n=1 Tax=Sphaerothrix gracilis TaxID=3151835 RepID=UPI0031FD413E